MLLVRKNPGDPKDTLVLYYLMDDKRADAMYTKITSRTSMLLGAVFMLLGASVGTVR